MRTFIGLLYANEHIFAIVHVLQRFCGSEMQLRHLLSLEDIYPAILMQIWFLISRMERHPQQCVYWAGKGKKFAFCKVDLFADITLQLQHNMHISWLRRYNYSDLIVKWSCFKSRTSCRRRGWQKRERNLTICTIFIVT